MPSADDRLNVRSGLPHLTVALGRVPLSLKPIPEPMRQRYVFVTLPTWTQGCGMVMRLRVCVVAKPRITVLKPIRVNLVPTDHASQPALAMPLVVLPEAMDVHDLAVRTESDPH